MLEEKDTNSNLFNTLLLAVFIVALILRLSLLFWGFPYIDKFSGYFHSDEGILKTAIYDFPRDIVTRTQLVYPTGYQYLLAIIVLPIKLFLQADGSLSVSEKGLIDLIAKLITILLSLATVFLVYKFGILLSKNRYIGLLSAALMAIVTVSVNDATFITTDTALAFFVTLFIYLVLKSFANNEKVTTAKVIFFGVLLGFCASVKYNGAMAIIVLPWLLYDYIKQRKWKELGLAVGLFAITSVITFFVATPSALIHPKALFDSIKYIFDWDNAATRPGYYLFLLFYIKAFNIAISILCVVAVVYYVFAIVHLLISRIFRKSSVFDVQSTILVIPMVVLILLFSWYFRHRLMPRYFLIVVPIWILVGVMLWFNWWKKFPRSAILCMILVMLFSLQSVTINWVYHVKDNRRTATKYIIKNNLSGTVVNHMAALVPSLAGTKLKSIDCNNPDYLILCTFHLPVLTEFLKKPFEAPEGPRYESKFYVQYPSTKERYDLLVDAVIQKESYTLVKRYEIEQSWITKACVSTLWEPDISIYKRNKE